MESDYLMKSERLYLREFLQNDAENLYFLNADPVVLKYTGDKPLDNVSDAEHFIANYDNYIKDGFGRWAVVLGDNTFIGWCGLKKHESGIVDLGFRLSQKHWGNGYATEAAMLCIEYAFNEIKLKRLIGRTDKRNIASIRVLEKCGFRFDKFDKVDGLGETAIYYLDNYYLNNYNL